ncbi:MAG: swr1 complex component [Caeruleum heppii]|nr:MAG: swr1 complex component [Caeruleum heppii]
MRSRSRSGHSNHEDDNHHHTAQNASKIDSPVRSKIETANANVSDDVNSDGPPSKKRKVVEAIMSRPPSPPWKKVIVDGPTSFVEGGRRKSSRTNAIPLELQPPSEKRQTRSNLHRNLSTRNRYGRARNDPMHTARPRTADRAVADKRPRSASKPSSNYALRHTPTKSARVKEALAQPSLADTSPSKRTRTMSSSHTRHSLMGPSTGISSSQHPHRTRRATRASDVMPKGMQTEDAQNGHISGWSSPEPAEVDPNVKTPRLKFRVRMPKVPIQHPAHIPRPRVYASFQDWLRHDDPLSGEDGRRITDKEAKREATLRARILDAARPGGILSHDKCSVYAPDTQEEPDRQYAHQDHLVAQAIYFRKLMNMERRQHVTAARRLAHAAAAEWKRRQPKTIEEVMQEQRDASLARYRSLRKDLQAKWDLVSMEVNRRKLVRWEEEQQLLGKQALNEMLEHSTQLLDARKARRSSEVPSDEERSQTGSEESDSADGDASESDGESNMSSTASDSDDMMTLKDLGDDERLTVEQLRQKYSSLPEKHMDISATVAPVTPDSLIDMNLEHPKKQPLTQAPDDCEAKSARSTEDVSDRGVSVDEVDDALLDDSDVSTNMDDDMGDSDEDDDGESERDSATDADEEEGEKEEEEEAETGLLGFFAPKELGLKHISVPPSAPERHNKVSSDALQPPIESPKDAALPTQQYAPLSETGSDEVDLVGRQPEHVVGPSSSQLVGPNGETDTVAISSETSPDTNATTKPSEMDSASSIEPHEDGKHESCKTTPQPTPQLKTPVPFLLRGTLREYQHYGLDWLAGLYANGTNGILADEMGLGKTIQTIALLAHLACVHEVWGPHLIVVPTSVMLNWEMEFKKWCPGFKILTYYGTQEERKQKRKGWMDDNRWHVCITSYQLVLQDQQTFKRRNWHYMVLDEAHNIKNFRSQRWQTLLTFKTRARLLLTGTPLQNNLTELWSLLFFLMPSDSTEHGIGGFADLKEFSEWFRRPVEQILEHGRETMDDEARNIVTKLHRVLRPYLLRRLKADVEKQMPGKYEHVVYCRLSKRQRYLYDGFMARAQTRETLASGNYLSIINCLMQLRKVCNHPDLFETRQIVTSFAMPKAAVAEFEIKELLVRRRLLRQEPMAHVNLDFLNLMPTVHEGGSHLAARESSRLSATRAFQELCRRQLSRIDGRAVLDATNVATTLGFLENGARKSRLEELRHCVYLNHYRSQRQPIYGSGLMKRLKIDCEATNLKTRQSFQVKSAEDYLDTSDVVKRMAPSLKDRSQMLETTIQKFACLTPAVVATDMVPLTLTPNGVDVVHKAQRIMTEDAFHEARIRLSIAFPDKRLLQYDCGKLQRLDHLLRQLQAGGHRALIFTQMTKVLDILEQFLNIHGHRYLRLDGATKIEQRQILTDRFNNDPRILAFILSSRSGGLGINLTGADTVIFYDLDWNPAMDKQCQDRCHRIGQTRDVHIYRFVSEYTIESNILRKANQKRMLDDVVIQEGEFTTDYFNKLSVRDMLGDDVSAMDGDTAASAAMDRVLGGGAEGPGVGRVLEQVEDREDIVAAKVAEKELVHTDEADFEEKATTDSADGATPRTAAPLGTPRESQPPTPSVTQPTAMSPSEAPSTARQYGLQDNPTQLQPSTDAATPDPASLGGGEVVNDGDSEDEEPGHVDDFMLRFMEWDLRHAAVQVPADKVKNKAKSRKAHVVSKGHR